MGINKWIALLGLSADQKKILKRVMEYSNLLDWYIRHGHMPRNIPIDLPRYNDNGSSVYGYAIGAKIKELINDAKKAGIADWRIELAK